MTSQIPKSIDEVDVGWVNTALSTRWPGVKVADLVVEPPVHGAGTKAKLHLTYTNQPSGLPSVMWIKAGWESHSEWLASCLQLYAREARFYGEMNPVLKINAPSCYYASFANSGHGVVLIEDLIERGARLTTCTESASFEQMQRSLRELAKLHASHWDGEYLKATHLDVPMRPDDHSSDWPRSNGPDVIAKYMSTERGALMPEEIRDPERIDRAFWVHLEDMQDSQPKCLLHGDTHPGNGYVDADGSPGFFDWQTIAKGPWAYDVSYHIVSSLAVEDRRRHEKDLLQVYLEKLAELGARAPPAFDDAWLQYRRYIAYGLHIWITNPATFQSEANCSSMTTRFSTAASDLDFFEAWGV